MLEALILTSAVVLSLTGYTFWASKRGQDFSFLGPILFASLIVLFLTGFLQVGLLLYFFCLNLCGTIWISRVKQFNFDPELFKQLLHVFVSDSNFAHNLICSCSSLLDLQSMLFTVQ